VSTPQPQSFWAQAAVEFQQYWITSGGGTAAATGGGPAAAAQGSPASVAGSGSVTLAPAYTGLEQLYGEVCTDTSNPRNPSAYPALAQRAASRSGGYGIYQTWLDEPCAQWPGKGIADRYPGPWNRPTANTILVFGNTGDPVTPYQDSVAMAHDLGNARLFPG
jgi:TAP-like protein